MHSLVFIYVGTHVVLGSRLHDMQADLFKNKATSNYPFRKLKNKKRRVYTCQNVSIPSIPEIQDFETKLSDLHEENVSAQLVLSTRETVVLQTSFRLAMLAYGRNSGKSLLYRGISFKDSEEVSLIELQFKSSRHRRGNMDDTGHLVAYIIKLQGGVGIVLSYKGSTNMADWKANMRTFSKKMFPDSDKEEVMVHNGFLQHKGRLDKRMLQAKMAPIAKLLLTWGVTPFENFRDFLLSGQWKWCICVGHSLGGAMSAIAALELAVYGAGNPVYAIGIGTAIPGNQQFSWLMDKHVRPKGGLRIANEGDAIAFMGLGGVSFSRKRRVVHGYEWILPHHWGRTYFKRLKNHIQYDILDWDTIPKRFIFPRVGEHYTSNDDQIAEHYSTNNKIFSEIDP